MAEVTEVMRPVFDTVRAGQEMWVGTIRTWTEFVPRFWPGLFWMPSEEQSPWPAEMVESSFDFARKWLDVQEEFTRVMVGATEPLLGLPKAEETKPQRASKAASEKSSG